MGETPPSWRRRPRPAHLQCRHPAILARRAAGRTTSLSRRCLARPGFGSGTEWDTSPSASQSLPRPGLRRSGEHLTIEPSPAANARQWAQRAARLARGGQSAEPGHRRNPPDEREAGRGSAGARTPATAARVHRAVADRCCPAGSRPPDARSCARSAKAGGPGATPPVESASRSTRLVSG